MQKNSITNKISPCGNLPFSMVYWWVSNLTLNSESDRQFILSKISQNGIISIEAWKVLANSATLEADASFTKPTLLSWFDCGNQPSKDKLKIIIEGLKVGNWTPETQVEIPLNLATVDKTMNGSTYVGNTYNKAQTDAKINTVKSEMLSGIKGVATQTNAPTNFSAETFPNGLFERYIVNTPLTSPNNWGNLVVTQEDLNENTVYLNVTNGVVSLELSAKPLQTEFQNWVLGKSGLNIGNNFLRDLPTEQGKLLNIATGGVDNVGGFTTSGFLDLSKIDSILFPYSKGRWYTWYNDSKVFISGSTDSGIITKPQNAKYLRISYESAYDNNYNLIASSKRESDKLMLSANVGNGGFDTITKAVDALDGGVNLPITIYLDEGEYDERLRFRDKKITIIGKSKDKTIIIAKKGDYYEPAMEVSGNCYFENLTFKETSENISNPPPPIPAYAVHMDYPGDGTMEFNNCVFESNSHSCVGIGLHKNQIIRFLNCSFIGKTDGNAPLLAHNSVTPDGKQRLEVLNCIFYSEHGSGAIMALTDAAWTYNNQQLVDNDTTFLFVGNTAKSINGSPWVHCDPAGFGSGKIAGNIKLDEMSFNNKIALINF